MPVYNEELHIAEFVDYLMQIRFDVECQFIFIDDGSSDNTALELRRLQETYEFQLILQKTNQGKGAAIRKGFEAATGDFVVIQDADFEYDPNDINILLQPLLRNQCDVVFGSRFKQSSPQVHRTYHYFINRILTQLSNLFSGIYLTDMETCYKVVRRDLLQSMRLKSNRFGIEVELTALIAKTRARIFEIPISYFPRTILQGKKINWKDGVAALFHIIDFNLFSSPAQCFESLPDKYKTEVFRQNKQSTIPICNQEIRQSDPVLTGK